MTGKPASATPRHAIGSATIGDWIDTTGVGAMAGGSVVCGHRSVCALNQCDWDDPFVAIGS
jgi:hypothetical protein